MGGSPIDIERIASEQAKNVAEALKLAAGSSITEADFRGQAARVFTDAADKAGIALDQRDEHAVASGRVDSVYNRLIIEYKRPGTLKDNNSSGPNQKVITQIRGYITDLAKKERKLSTICRCRA